MQDPTEEDRIQKMIRDASPEQRKAVEWLFSLPQDTLERVLRRLNVEAHADQMTEDEVNAEIEAWIRERYPNAPADSAEWDQWPPRQASAE